MKQSLRFILPVLIAGLVTACLFVGDASVRHLGAATPPSLRNTPPVRHVVLVAIDGARWQEVFHGVDSDLLSTAKTEQAAEVKDLDAQQLLPNLHRLANAEGAWVGADDERPMQATGPNYVSLPGYVEITTGRSPIGCQDNYCELPRAFTLLDEWARVREDDTLAVFASWQGLGRLFEAPAGDAVLTGSESSALERGVLYQRLHGQVRRARRAEAFPGKGSYLPDPHTAALAKRYLREQEPNFMFIALGDTDEYAHRGDYPGYLKALQAADAAVGEIAKTLQELEERGASTVLMVTTDHGRARDFNGHGGFAPESARVWLLAAGRAVKARGFAASRQPRRLADIAPTVRALAGLPRRAGPHSGEVLTELF